MKEPLKGKLVTQVLCGDDALTWKGRRPNYQRLLRLADLPGTKAVLLHCGEDGDRMVHF